MTTKPRRTPPKDVCPYCQKRGCRKVQMSKEQWVEAGRRTLWTCPHCRSRFTWNLMLHYTPDERRAAEELNLERNRRYKREHKQRVSESHREWAALNRDRVNRWAREKYRSDPEFREKRKANAARYQLENREHVSARYMERYRSDPAFRHAHALRSKKCRMKRWKSEHGGE